MGELPDEEEKVVSQRWNHESKCSLTSSSSLSLTSARLAGEQLISSKFMQKFRMILKSMQYH